MDREKRVGIFNQTIQWKAFHTSDCVLRREAIAPVWIGHPSEAESEAISIAFDRSSENPSCCSTWLITLTLPWKPVSSPFSAATPWSETTRRQSA